MQKSKKIEVYLKKHPRATRRDLEKKFRLSAQEAGEYLGEEKETGFLFQNSFLQRLSLWFSHETRVLGTLFILALFVRLVYAFFVLRDPLLTIPLHDAKYYFFWAQDILQHGWLGEKIFFTEPFYAYFLALFLKFFGGAGTTILLLFQWLSGSLVSVGLYLVTKKLFNRQAGIITGVLSALYAPFIFYEGLLLKTGLEVALLPWFFLLLLWAFEKKTPRSFLLVGFFLGLLSLVKGNNLLFAPMIIGLLWYLLREGVMLKRLVLTGVFVFGVALFILPVTLRNFIVGDDIVLTNYSFGLVAYQGSWWGGDGSTGLVPPFLRPDPTYEETDAVGMAEAYAEKKLKPSEVSSFWLSKAIEEIISAPLHFGGTLMNKVLILFSHSEFSDNYQFVWYRAHVPLLWILPNFSLICLLGLLGLLLIFSKHFWKVMTPMTVPSQKHFVFSDRALILAGLLVSSVAVLLLTTVNARYRIPIVPFLLIFSGGAGAYLWECFRNGEHSRLFALGGVSFFILLLLWYPLSFLRFDTGAQSYHALGYEALVSLKYPEAREFFQQTIAIDPNYAWAYGNLALATVVEDGQYEEALGYLKKRIVLRPDDLSNYRLLIFLKSLEHLDQETRRAKVAEHLKKDERPDYDADFNEAERYRAEGDWEKAEMLYRRSLANHADAPATGMALAGLLKQQEKPDEAKRLLKQVVEQHPEIFPARYNLANSYIEENNFGQVVLLLKDIYEFTPELGETWYNYAVALIKLNRNAEAIPVMQAYIERYQDDATRRTVVEKFRTALKPVSGNSIDSLLQGGAGK
ncbi:MAG: tetratricopeptide repeat protein [Candidatus Moranbacteria bacterium]|nr:tetratricopeptide repeat protein [Candidatus Moranbacteria bacterium]